MLYKTPIHVFVCKVRQKLWCHIGKKKETQISWPWKHFFSSKIVLRVIACCLRGVGSMSSSRRIPRFIILFSSWRRYGLMSSLRHFYVFVSSGLPFVDCPTYLGRYLMYGDIYCTVTLLPCYLFTLLPYCSVPLLFCPFVTLLPSSLIPLSLCCQFF